jgi:hypothetical protein
MRLTLTPAPRPRAVLQHVDGPVRVHVDQDRGIGMAAPFREVIHAKDRDLADHRIGQGADQPDQRCAGDRDAQRAGQPRPGPPGQGQRDRFQQAALQRCPTLMQQRHRGHLLGEGPQLTCRVTAEEPPHLQADRHGPAARRHVMKTPPVPAVDPRRRQAAPMTGGLCRTGPGRDQHSALSVLDLVDLQAVQMREEQVETAGFLACQGMLHNDPRGRS